MGKIHYRTCNLCEAMCGLALEVEGERLISIRGDAGDVFSQGHICPKAVALGDLHSDPDRIRSPQRRVGDGWEAISWDDAFHEIGERIAEIRTTYGRDSVAVYLGNPNVHNYGSLLTLLPFLEALETRNRFSATSADQLPQMLAAYLMFGHQLLLPVPDVDRTDYFLMLGANPLESNGSLMSAGGIKRRLEHLVARGGQLVVVDPRRTRTAELATRHLFIRPGSDAFFLAAILFALFEEDRVHLHRLEPFVQGVAELRGCVALFSPEAVAGRVGVPAKAIRQVARDFGTARAAVCYGRMGASAQEFGGLAAWLVNAVNIVTGNLDRPGGAMFTTPAADLVEFTARLGHRGGFARWRSRVRGLREFGGELPLSALAEEMDTPGQGQVRALITVAGNPVLSTPNSKRLERALARIDFMVSIDLYRNETARHAHFILPPTSPLERSHYDLVFQMLAVRNGAKYSPALFPPPEGALHDWQILLELAERLTTSRPPLARAVAMLRNGVLQWLGPEGILDLLLRFGPYGRGVRPLGGGLDLGRLKSQVHGIDLGPLRPVLPGRLYTRNKQLFLCPPAIAMDMRRLRESMRKWEGNGAHSLRLIGRRELRSNNTWLHNSQRLLRGQRPLRLTLHPSDAKLRGIEEGQSVEVCSRTGKVEALASLTEAIMPGVVCLPFGWGHGKKGARLGVANKCPGVNINELTDELFLDDLSGNAGLNGVPVTLHPVDLANLSPDGISGETDELR